MLEAFLITTFAAVTFWGGYAIGLREKQEEIDDLKDQIELLENQINSRISAHLSRAFRDRYRDN